MGIDPERRPRVAAPDARPRRRTDDDVDRATAVAASGDRAAPGGARHGRGARHEPHRRRDERWGRFERRRGAPGAARRVPSDEVIGVWMRTHGDLPRGLRAESQLLLARTPPTTRDASPSCSSIPFFMLNVEREFGAARDRRLRRRLPRRRDAEPVPGVQPVHQVRRAPAAAAWRPTAPMRSRPATTRGSSTATAAGASCARPTPTRTRPTSSGCSTRRSWLARGSRSAS